MTALSGAVYDLPGWARTAMVLAGLSGVVVVIVGSLNVGQVVEMNPAAGPPTRSKRT